MKFKQRLSSKIILLSLFMVNYSMAQNRNGNGIIVAGTRPPYQKPIAGQTLERRDTTYGTNQKPAFKGQTRTVAVITQTPYREQVVATGLFHPWSIAFLPDGRMLITEKRGSLKIVTQDGLVSDTIRGLPRNIVYGGDAGLLDIVIDPDFKTNRTIYFSFSERRELGSGLSVATAVLSNDEFSLRNLKVIYRISNDSKSLAHYGSRLLFDKTGKLFVSTSERMDEETRVQAQWLSSALGKILRINTDGTPAAGNPVFPDSPNALKEIWAYGFRNPQGLCYNPVTGDLWEDEHGTQGGDEVNIVKPGKNYGWPVIAYGAEYTGGPIEGNITQKAGMEQPIYYWDPTIAPSGSTFYNGRVMPEWNGNLFIAALAGQHVVRLVIKNNRVTGEERLLLDQHQRMRDIVQGPDGALWVVTDAENGRLIRIDIR
jgi:aldose sugar dehydrogenase